MPVLSLACHLQHNTPNIPSRYNNEQTTKQTKAIKTHIYINISCKCDTNRAGHFTLDAYASRPVACGFICVNICLRVSSPLEIAALFSLILHTAEQWRRYNTGQAKKKTPYPACEWCVWYDFGVYIMISVEKNEISGLHDIEWCSVVLYQIWCHYCEVFRNIS